MNKGEIIMYQTPDGITNLDVRLENETIWLTQAQIAELFGTKGPAITKHLNNIYKSGELDEISTCSILEHKGNDARGINWLFPIESHSDDTLLTVGFNLRSNDAIHSLQSRRDDTTLTHCKCRPCGACTATAHVSTVGYANASPTVNKVFSLREKRQTYQPFGNSEQLPLTLMVLRSYGLTVF